MLSSCEQRGTGDTWCGADFPRRSRPRSGDNVRFSSTVGVQLRLLRAGVLFGADMLHICHSNSMPYHPMIMVRRSCCPGFIDAPYPLSLSIGCWPRPARDLLDWLNRFTFPEECRYASAAHARTAAEIFLDRLVQHGTTAAVVFSTVASSCD